MILEKQQAIDPYPRKTVYCDYLHLFTTTYFVLVEELNEVHFPSAQSTQSFSVPKNS